jgi:hypothetical protein
MAILCPGWAEGLHPVWAEKAPAGANGIEPAVEPGGKPQYTSFIGDTMLCLFTGKEGDDAEKQSVRSEEEKYCLRSRNLAPNTGDGPNEPEDRRGGSNGNQ